MKEFFSGGFRVYRRSAFVANLSLAAVLAYTVSGHWAGENLDYARALPKDPEISQIDPGPAPDLPWRDAPVMPVPDAPETATPVADQLVETGFNYQDYQGILAQSMRVPYAAAGAGVLIKNVTAKEFDVPDAEIDEETHHAIQRASDITGVPKGVLYAFASKESNFVKTASADTSSAQGMFQFTETTWRNVIKTFGPALGFSVDASQIHGTAPKTWFSTRSAARRILRKRDNVDASALMTAALMLDDQERVTSVIGRPLELDEYYVTHFLGSGSAATFLRNLDRNPNAHVNTVGAMGPAIRANRSVFIKNGRYRTFAETMDWFDDVMTKRIAYFTLKYDTENLDHMKFATSYAKKLGILERHDGQVAQRSHEFETEVAAQNEPRYFASNF